MTPHNVLGLSHDPPQPFCPCATTILSVTLHSFGDVCGEAFCWRLYNQRAEQSAACATERRAEHPGTITLFETWGFQRRQKHWFNFPMHPKKPSNQLRILKNLFRCGDGKWQ